MAAPHLLLRMFGGRTRSGRYKSLLHHTEHVMKSGFVEEPVWLEAVRQCVPAPALRKASHALAPQDAAARAPRRHRASAEDNFPGGASY